MSLDRRWLFVGCKDGSVTAIDLTLLDSPHAECTICGAGSTTGVRALCDLAGNLADDPDHDLGKGWLLLGQDGGGVCALRYDDALQQPYPVALAGLERAGAVGYVGRWGDGSFVISPRQAEAFLVRLKKRTDEDRGGPPFEFEVCGTLPGVVALAGFACVSEDERWLVCKTGALWRVTGSIPSDSTRYWGHVEPPGFVYDVAVVRPDQVMAYDQGLYLSTDQGAFLMRRPRDSDDDRAFRLDATHLPGMTGMCLAVTHAVHNGKCFLWVSDVEGSVHLYWSDESRLGRRPVWHRSGLRQGNFPVMRAVAHWGPEEPPQALVGQACRDDRVVVTTYRAKLGTELPDPLRADEVLSWSTATWLRQNLPPGPEEWRQHRGEWRIEALVADQIEEVGRDQERLRRFLRNPGIGLACSALHEMMDPPESSDKTRAEQALVLWTHTLVGTVHRSLAQPSTEDYLGIIRWLRRLGDRCQAMDGMRDRLAACIQFTRKWGVFGSTYASRARAYSALRPLAGQPAEERRFDRLIYECIVFQRRIDLEQELSPSTRPSLTPWDLKYLNVPMPEPAAPREEDRISASTSAARLSGSCREFLSASWIDNGLIFERSGGDE